MLSVNVSTTREPCSRVVKIYFFPILELYLVQLGKKFTYPIRQSVSRQYLGTAAHRITPNI